jgi:hypothetical protein
MFLKLQNDKIKLHKGTKFLVMKWVKWEKDNEITITAAMRSLLYGNSTEKM